MATNSSLRPSVSPVPVSTNSRSNSLPSSAISSAASSSISLLGNHVPSGPAPNNRPVNSSSSNLPAVNHTAPRLSNPLPPTPNQTPANNAASNKVPSKVAATNTASSPPAGGQTKTKHKRRITTVLLQGFASLWLAPMVTLLVLNIRGHIIGPSAWCPTGDCFIDRFGTAKDQKAMEHFDKNDHNLLGILQLVAKVLEKWFEVIAASMVYLLLMRIASSKEGLPVGYWTRAAEFSDILRSFEPGFWRIGFKSSKGLRRGLVIWAFVILTVLLSILCNLMGPATAVLVIPNLQWLETPSYAVTYFTGLDSGSAPRPDGFTMQDLSCSQANVSDHQWSCTDDLLATQLYESMAPTTMNPNWYPLIMQAGTCSYSFNWSSTDRLLIWAPNRQTIANISNDLAIVDLISQGYTNGCQYPFPDANVSINCIDNSTYNVEQNLWDSYNIYNNTLRMVLQRAGPILGAYLNINVLNSTFFWPTPDANIKDVWTTNATADKQIRCYPEYFPLWEVNGNLSNNFTRCIQTGTDWDSDTKHDMFILQGKFGDQSHLTRSNGTLASSDVRVDIYSSSRAAFLPNGTLPEGIPSECLAPGTIHSDIEPSCDWNKFFAPNQSLPVANLSSHSTTVEFSTSAGLQLVLDMTAYLNYTTYTYDSSTIGNFMNFVETQDVPLTGTVVPLDPAWILTAWSVDSGGTITNDKPPATIVTDWFYQGRSDYADDYLDFLIYPHLLALSLVDYREQPLSKVADVKDSILLERSAVIYVWAYAMSSRTAYLGATVVMLGVIVVIAQVILGSFDHRERHSLTEMLVAALEHTPHDEFKGLEHSEVQAASVPFRVAEAKGSAGKIAFVSPTSA